MVAVPAGRFCTTLRLQSLTHFQEESVFRIQQVWPGIVLALVTAGSATAQTADEPAGKALAERYLTALGTPQLTRLRRSLKAPITDG